MSFFTQFEGQCIYDMGQEVADKIEILEHAPNIFKELRDKFQISE